MPLRHALLLVSATLAAALYEEPPGGCKGPPDDFEPLAANPDGPKAIRRSPRPPPPQAPPSTKSKATISQDEEESQAELQRQAYEQESSDLLGDSGEDWDLIEREHNRELFVRLCLQIIASMMTMGFVASLLWTRYKQLQGAPKELPATEAEASTGTTHLKVEGMTCDACCSKMEMELKAVAGVTGASVNLKSKRAMVTGSATPESLIAAVEALGKKAEVVVAKKSVDAIDKTKEAEVKAKPEVKAKADEGKKEAERDATSEDIKETKQEAKKSKKGKGGKSKAE